MRATVWKPDPSPKRSLLSGRWRWAAAALGALAMTSGGAGVPREAQALMQAYVKAFNQNEAGVMAAFATEHLDLALLTFLNSAGGPEGYAQRNLVRYRRYGPMDLVAVAPGGEESLETLGVNAEGQAYTAFLRGKDSRYWMNIVFKLNPAQPRLINAAGFFNGGRPIAARRPTPSTDAARQGINRLIDDLVRQHRFSGVALVLKDGKPLVQRAAGQANPSGDPITLESRFPLASLSKLFTSVAVLQLAEQGKLDLSAPASRYLPGDLPADLTGVKVSHLLSHKSGLETDLSNTWGVVHTTRELLYLNEPRLFPAGERFSYSNFGFMLLGGIIASASSQDYPQYVRDHILTPAGMGGVKLHDPRVVPPQVAVSLRDNGAAVEVEDQHGGDAAGDWLASATDIARFASALVGGKLLKPQTLARALQPQATVFRLGGFEEDYGLGVELWRTLGVRGFGHGGDGLGRNTMLAIYPDLGYTVVVLSNRNEQANILSDGIRDILIP